VSRDSDRMRWLGHCDSRGCFIEQRWHLTELDGTLPRGANFGDLDAWAEFDGRFLFIEHKPEGFAWKRDDGQWLALKRLNALPGVTVWWMRDCGDGYEIAEPGGELAKISKAELRDRVRAWARGTPIQGELGRRSCALR
jgi:hypothetical protein